MESPNFRRFGCRDQRFQKEFAGAKAQAVTEALETLAAEVEEPSKVYMPAMVICVVASPLVYLLPILVGVSAEGTEVSLWVDGYWSEVGGAIGGEALGGEPK